MANERFRTVWDAIEPDAEKAAALEMSANAMIAINDAIKSMDDVTAAAFIGSTVEQARAIRAGHIDLFTADTLAGFISYAGLRPAATYTVAA